MYYNNCEQNILYHKKEAVQLMSPVEFFRNLPNKVCPECGQQKEEQAESYMIECERCLANKEE
jgi:hypothetical protein